jgi:hypothetical protein
MSWAGREHERPTGMTCAQGRSCEFRGRGESKREGSITFFIHIESSYVNMILLKIEKNNHHGNNNYYRDQRIMGHIICTMVLDCHKNGGRIDCLSIDTEFTVFIAFSQIN